MIKNKEIRASVAMAVYNGEKFISEQISSILTLMNENDELVISYEKSSDRTLEIIHEFAETDGRIHIVYDNNHSVESNFNNAIANCQGNYIFLSDQDDVWINDKINKMVLYFQENPKVKILIGNGLITSSDLTPKEDLFTVYKMTTNAFKNFIKGSYLGCQMAFDATIKDEVWPVSVCPALPHDLWLGIVGSFYGKVVAIDENLILHRLHGSNYSDTSKMNLFNVVRNRVHLAIHIIGRITKNLRKKNDC